MREFTVSSAEAGQRLWHYITRVLPGAQAGLLRKSLRKKNILLGGKKADGREVLAAGDVVRVYFSDETLAKFMAAAASPPREEKTPPAALSIIYEDGNTLILDKPAGLLTQGDGSVEPSLNGALLDYLHDSITPAFRPSICNRLDRNTSGLVIAGKTVEALQALNELIRRRDVRKEYEAILYGTLTGAGTLKGFLVKDHAANRVRYTERKEPGAVPIETRYEVLRNFTVDAIPVTLVKAALITGRSHQLRLHFAGTGHPILGDRKYGSRESLAASRALGARRQLLHAARLTFPELTGALAPLTGKTFTAPLPEDMGRLLGPDTN